VLGQPPVRSRLWSRLTLRQRSTRAGR
jgi:hypothetical protein